MTMTSDVITVLKNDSKSDIRNRVWDHLMKSRLAAFPLPSHGRIPNFKGSSEACDLAAGLSVFSAARNVKADPDKPLEQIRFRTLEAGKTLFVPTPRLRSGLLNKVQVPTSSTASSRRCATLQGIRDHSRPFGLNEKTTIDLLVVGCVAASPKGWRIGKGEGYSDMEFALMVSVYAVDRDVPVVVVVHDCQVMNLPDHLFGAHDLSVDYIVTPTRVIECKDRPPRPSGIIWSFLTTEKLAEIPVLRLMRLQEEKMGKDVHLADETVDVHPVTMVTGQPNMQETFSHCGSTNAERNDETFHRLSGVGGRVASAHAKQHISTTVCRTTTDDSRRDVVLGWKKKTEQCEELERNDIKRKQDMTVSDINSYTENKNKIAVKYNHTANEGGNPSKIEYSQSNGKHKASGATGCLFIGNLPMSVSVRELKDVVRSHTDELFTVKWLGSAGYAFLNFESLAVAEEALVALKGMQIQGKTLRVETARQVGQPSRSRNQLRRQNKEV